MQNVIRRSFVKSLLAGSVVVAAGAGVHRAARAAEEIKDVKFAKNLKSLQAGLETAHTPSIIMEKADAESVAYGKTPAGDFYRVTVQASHEATKDHHIFGIALYLNGELIAEHTMNQAQPEASLPAVTFVQRLKTGDELLAVTSCNVHGKWGNRTIV